MEDSNYPPIRLYNKLPGGLNKDHLRMPASRVLQVSGIEAKLHLPSTAARPATLAIIAHPWARLGGNWRDSYVILCFFSQTGLRLAHRYWFLRSAA